MIHVGKTQNYKVFAALSFELFTAYLCMRFYLQYVLLVIPTLNFGESLHN